MASRKTVLVVNLVVTVFFLLNAIAIVTGLHIYPTYWHFVFFGAILGNLLWLLMPLLFTRHSSPPFRLARAVLGPFWVYWTFLIFIYSAFILALGLIWFTAVQWFGVPFFSFIQTPSDIFLAILGFISVIGLIQALFLLKVEKVTIKIKNLPADFAGYKIAMTTDLHVGLFSRPSRLNQFSKAVQQHNPDLFIVCGDITDDDPHYLPKFLKSLEGLDPYLPAYGVLGNHDVYANPEKTLHILENSRLTMLVNEGLEIKKGNSVIWLAGVGDQGARRIGKWGSVAPDFDKAIEKKPAGAITVLMAHQPQGFLEAADRQIELTLSGHTHGGQFGFKWLKWSLAKPFLKYDMGLFEKNGSQLYVSSGTGFWVLPIRFGLSPEVSLIELQPA
ncbi:MAG TPA: metallophosphoesterase [bacterium]|nr:metallophosphoesterase [bacterium]